MHDYERKRLDQINTWRERVRDVPFVKFDPEWEVAVIPPFGGVDARFLVKFGKAGVSVYLDFYNNAGYMPGPYWEVYPHDGDCFRAMLTEPDELLRGIRESIEQQSKEGA